MVTKPRNLKLKTLVFAIGLLAGRMGGVARPPQRQSSAKPPAPSEIRISAPSVVVDVIVTDRKGRYVPNLTAKDFAVSEDEVPQRIVTFVPPASFGPKTEPPQRAREKTVEVQRRSQMPPPASTPQLAPGNKQPDFDDLQFISLVMDMGDMRPADRHAACEAAMQYLNQDLSDYVSIYSIEQNKLQPLLPFSRDRDAAERAIQVLDGRTPSGYLTTNERSETEHEIAELKQKESDDEGSGAALGDRLQWLALQSTLWNEAPYQARAVLGALRAVARTLATLPGRKNVVLFSDGFMNSRSDADQVAEAINEANRANLTFYVIDASGLSVGKELLSAESTEATGEHLTRGEIEGPPVPDTVAAEMNEMTQAGPEPTFGTDKFDWAEHIALSDPDSDLETIATGTGGLMIRNRNDLLGGLERVASDLRDCYTLVYEPTNTNYDGAFRRIRVTVNQPGLELRYRKGYWAVPDTAGTLATPATAQLINAAEAGTLQPVFHPAMNAAELGARDGKWSAVASVLVPGKEVRFSKSADFYTAGATFVVVVTDRDGNLLGAYQRNFDFRLDEKKYQEFRETNFDLTGQVAIQQAQPLTVQVILQFSDGRVAVAGEQLSVPSGDGKMYMTSLVLADSVKPIDQHVADPSNPLQASGYEISLAPAYDFPQDALISAYFGLRNIHISPITNEPDLRVSSAIEADGKVVKSFPDVEINALRPGRNDFDFIEPLNLKNLGPGKYTFEVVVKDILTDFSVNASAGFYIR